jgi:hypothetical protein
LIDVVTENGGGDAMSDVSLSIYSFCMYVCMYTFLQHLDLTKLVCSLMCNSSSFESNCRIMLSSSWILGGKRSDQNCQSHCHGRVRRS